MTLEEKLKMYKEKYHFIENVNFAFQVKPGCPAVEGVIYELYKKTIIDVIDFREWIIVYYKGGGMAPKLVSCNSNSANFRVIGTMLEGGCYEEVDTYKLQEYFGYEKVEL